MSQDEIENRDSTGRASEEARLAQLDRLVDGELSDDERRELLSSLDATETGWRQLALAYVEAQTWRDDFGALAAPPREPLAEPAPQAARESESSTASPAPFKLMLAMAASFLVALTVGLQFRGGGDAPPAGEPTLTSFVETKPFPGDDRPAIIPQGSDLAADTPSPAVSNPDASIPATPNTPAGPNATPVFNVGSQPSQAEATSTIPPNIAEMLRRLRHRIERRRSLVPVETEDGRQMLIPVEDVEVHYVGEEAYQ